MEKMSKYDEFIQPFLDGELSREELDWFSKELESNAVLAEDIRLYREVDSAIREHDVMELRDQLDVIHNSIGDPSVAPTKQSRYRRVLSYGAIASLAILLSLGVLLKVQHHKLSNKQILDRSGISIGYDISFPRSVQSENLDFQKLVINASNAFENEQYREAIPLFEEILKIDPNDFGIALTTGISHILLEQFKQAEVYLVDIIGDDDNSYIEQAEWYLGFCYLGTGQNQVARDHLKKIAKSNSFYSKDARKLRKRIS